MKSQCAKICQHLSLALIVSSLLSGCGSDNEPETLQGRFLDSAVEGLSYTSGEMSGVTDAEGNFSYLANQTIVFRIGNIVIGEVMGADIITPLSFQADNPSLVGNVAINLSRLLQTLDSDRNPDNGIVITPSIVEELGALSLDFSLTPTQFSNNENVQAILTMISEGTDSLTLVEEAAAVAHLVDSLSNAGITVSVEDSSPDAGDDGSTGGDDAGDDSSTGGDDAGDDGNTGGDDAGDDGSTGGDDASDDGSTGGDDASDDSSTGGDDVGDDSNTGGDDAGDGGSHAGNTLTLTGNHTSIFGTSLLVNDIAYGVSDFTGVEQSLLMVGGEDLQTIEELLALRGAPSNAFMLIAVFETQANQRASSFTIVKDNVEYFYECTTNCEFEVDIANRTLTYNDALFIWDEGEESLTIAGSIPWFASDEYVSSEGQGELGDAESNEICDLNMSSVTESLADAGLAYSVEQNQCIGLKDIEVSRATKPFVLIDENSASQLASGEMKISIRHADSAVTLFDDAGAIYLETTVLATFSITNASEMQLCGLAHPDWELTRTDGSVYTQNVTLYYTYNDENYEYSASEIYRDQTYGVDCIQPGQSRTVNLELSTYSAESQPLMPSEIASASVVFDAEYKTATADSVAYLQADYLEWTYVNGKPALRLALTNTTGKSLVFDDSSQNVLFYDSEGYLVSSGYVYIHDQLGLTDEVELMEADYIFAPGTQFLLLNDSPGIAHLALSPATATKAVLYPRFK